MEGTQYVIGYIHAVQGSVMCVKCERRKSWLPGPDANIRPMGLQPMREVLWLQRLHLIPGWPESI
jgi:hypothetical protein